MFSCSVVSDSFVTPWTIVHKALLSMGFPRQEYWSRLPFPSSGDLSYPGTKPMPPYLLHWQVDSLLLSQQRSPFSQEALILMSFSSPFNLVLGDFLTAPPLISNCSNLLFGTQDSCRPESCLQEMGDKTASMPGSPTGPCSVSVGPYIWVPLEFFTFRLVQSEPPAINQLELWISY